MQHHVFLSYSRKNLTMMQRIRDDLRASGLQVWTDEGIEPGSISWKEAIETAIRETAIMIVLLSPSANDSRWVQREIDYAETQNKPILPLLVKGQERDAIPFALAGSQFIDVRKDYTREFSVLMRKCFSYLPSSNMPTVPSKQAETTIINRRMLRYKQKKQNWLVGTLVFSLVVLISAFLIVRSSELPSAVVVAESMPIETLDIIYNADSLVILNATEQIIHLDGWVFELASGNQRYHADDWLTQTLVSGRCAQVWGLNVGYLSMNVSPASNCDSRVAYRAIDDVFWFSENPRHTFAIMRYNTVIAYCPVISTPTQETTTCSINLTDLE